VWRTSLSLLIAFTAWGADKYQASEPHMGTLVSITLYADSREQAQQGFVASFARIGELDATLSDYKPESALSRFCSLNALRDDLRADLAHAQRVARETDGAFDITAGPLTHLWRRARSEKRLPSESELRDARERSGYKRLQSFRCSVEGMQLDAGGIAKGYAGDQAIEALRRAGIRSALVAVSGDVVMSDPPPGQTGWRVKVQGEVHSLANAAVSTSGDEFQFVEIDGVKYSHIVDPRTGLPLRDSVPVSVIARTGIEADSLATAYAVQGKRGIVDVRASQ
jgi:thiamine biosynthesis lipoprotein